MSLPYRQGGLDALCGLYAVANSLRHLGCDRPTVNRSLAAAINELGAATFAKRFLLNDQASQEYGLSPRHLVRALTAATEHANREAERPFTVLGFRDTTYSLASFWRALQEELLPSSKSCVVVSVSGRVNHWTTVIRASENLARLRDSDGLRVLQRRRCRGRNGRKSVAAESFYNLHPHDSFIVRR